MSTNLFSEVIHKPTEIIVSFSVPSGPPSKSKILTPLVCGRYKTGQVPGGAVFLEDRVTKYIDPSLKHNTYPEILPE